MNDTEGKAVLQLINEKQFLLEAQNDVVLDILSRGEHRQILNDVGEYRARIYTPLKTVYTSILEALSPDKSVRNAVAGVNVGRLILGKAAVCGNTGSFVKGKQRLPEGCLYELVKSLGRSSLKKVPGSWKVQGRDVKVFDGTILNLPDTKANQEHYPKHRNKNLHVGYPQIRLLAVFSLITGSVVDYALEATKGKGTGEVTLLRGILDCFTEGDIALGDALFCNFFLMHELMEKKVDLLVPGLIQRCYHFNEGTVLGENDHITQWKKPRRPKGMSQEIYKKYPKAIPIREFKMNGIAYMTTLMNASGYPKKELCLLYKRRWEAELHLRSLKTHMKMDRLSSKTPSMVRKEISIHLLAYNIIRELMVEGSIKANALPTKISFKGTLQLLNQFTPYFVAIPKDKKSILYSQMIGLIAKNGVGKRPGRVEPRAIRHKSQPFPALKTSRTAEREKILTKRKKWLAENKAA